MLITSRNGIGCKWKRDTATRSIINVYSEPTTNICRGLGIKSFHGRFEFVNVRKALPKKSWRTICEISQAVAISLLLINSKYIFQTGRRWSSASWESNIAEIDYWIGWRSYRHNSRSLLSFDAWLYNFYRRVKWTF